ncbi:hypothetical protein TRVL_06799 [Trypanosoma vivax]|nr:hypothetical protein TRVL_06799 [Trypanosoma vivax]
MTCHRRRSHRHLLRRARCPRRSCRRRRCVCVLPGVASRAQRVRDKPAFGRGKTLLCADTRGCRSCGATQGGAQGAAGFARPCAAEATRRKHRPVAGSQATRGRARVRNLGRGRLAAPVRRRGAGSRWSSATSLRRRSSGSMRGARDERQRAEGQLGAARGAAQTRTEHGRNGVEHLGSAEHVRHGNGCTAAAGGTRVSEAPPCHLARRGAQQEKCSHGQGRRTEQGLMIRCAARSGDAHARRCLVRAHVCKRRAGEEQAGGDKNAGSGSSKGI